MLYSLHHMITWSWTSGPTPGGLFLYGDVLITSRNPPFKKCCETQKSIPQSLEGLTKLGVIVLMLDVSSRERGGMVVPSTMTEGLGWGRYIIELVLMRSVGLSLESLRAMLKC